MIEKISNYIDDLDLNKISQERKSLLQTFINYLNFKLKKSEIINLNFICTHNSRRSHLSQIWAQTIADYFKFYNLSCYSGGTEETSIYPMVVETLEGYGFEATNLSTGKNPVIAIRYSHTSAPIVAFSKSFNHPFNPSVEFAAIMTCSDADENCPFIAGTEKRIALNYEDPKAYDGSSLQKEKYKEISTQIATEMKYVFSSLKSKLSNI